MNLPDANLFPFGSSPEFVGALKYHLAHPEVTLAEHRAQVRKSIVARAMGSYRLYIDTNHWTHLRDAHLNRARDPRYVDLYDLLKKLVDDSKIVVPFSDQLFEETCHQADSATRRATAEVADRLTRGVAIVRWERRNIEEVLQWVRALLSGGIAVPVEESWASLYDAFGLHELELSRSDEAFAQAFMKAVEDLAERIGCCGIMEFGTYKSGAAENWANLADELTGHKSTTWRDQGHFSEVFEEEALSYLDKVLVNLDSDVVSELKRLPHGHSLDGPLVVANVKRAFLACEQLSLQPKAIPGLRIIAGGHARIRTEGDRKFKRGDTADLFHAAAALPYCDAFVTDRSLCHMLTTQPSDLATLYGCAVFSSPEEVADHLARLFA